MEFTSFLLVVISAVSHAIWNMLAKKGRDKDSFMWLMILTSFFTLLPVFLILLPEITLPFSILPFLVISALAETLYFLSLGKAYSLGDLSITYPIARSSPLFLTILAVVVLGETISTWGIIGILLMVSGVYLIHLKGLSLQDVLEPVKNLGEPATRYALLTAFCTTAYSLSDKIGVTQVDPLLYAFWLEPFILLFITPVVIWRNGFKSIASEWKTSKINVSVSGFLMRAGYVLVLIAMSLTQVSYVLALRQLSVVLGALAGVLLLKEDYGRVRVFSSLIIFAGVYVLTVLA
jgi:uncharacterized membrane protein